MMLFKLVPLVCFAVVTTVQAASLLQAFNGTTQLSSLTALLASQPAAIARFNDLTNITIFAPNNLAISTFVNSTIGGVVSQNPDLLAAYIDYHVLNGTYQSFSPDITIMPTILTAPQYSNVSGGQRIEIKGNTIYSGFAQRSNILQSLSYSGGMIHIVDSLLSVPDLGSTAATKFNLSTFYEAANVIGTVAAFDTITNTTIFVPNNAAFQKLANNPVAKLSNSQLTSLLSYHVVHDTIFYSSQSTTNQTLRSLQGNNLTITVYGPNVTFINNARVITPNIFTPNGVIHIIDTVLDPNNTTPPIPSYVADTSSTDEQSSTGSANQSPGSSRTIGKEVIAGIVSGVVVVVVAAVTLAVISAKKHPKKLEIFRRELPTTETLVSELRDGCHANRHELDGDKFGGQLFEKDGVSRYEMECTTPSETQSETHELSAEKHV